MKTNLLSFAHILVTFFLLISMLLGVSFTVIYPIWIVTSAIVAVLTLISWYKEDRSFKPFVPLTIALIGALAIAGFWSYIH